MYNSFWISGLNYFVQKNGMFTIPPLFQETSPSIKAVLVLIGMFCASCVYFYSLFPDITSNHQIVKSNN